MKKLLLRSVSTAVLSSMLLLSASFVAAEAARPKKTEITQSVEDEDTTPQKVSKNKKQKSKSTPSKKKTPKNKKSKTAAKDKKEKTSKKKSAPSVKKGKASTEKRRLQKPKRKPGKDGVATSRKTTRYTKKATPTKEVKPTPTKKVKTTKVKKPKVKKQKTSAPKKSTVKTPRKKAGQRDVRIEPAKKKSPKNNKNVKKDVVVDQDNDTK